MASFSLGRAVQYVRMSTEHQNYSVEYQSAANAAYAAERGLEIVRTYADEGISGLTLAGRAGLKALLADVLAGEPDFEIILIYDVSRWGRFQDLDEGAHYEFICRNAGVAIEYTAEPFANDGTLVAAFLKHMKRAMAAEYSRELSAKTARAKRGLALKGFWMGGPAPFGFRRRAVAPDGTHCNVMQASEQKALLGYRTVLVAGPPEEVEIVRLIFRMFVVWGLSMTAIAERLDADGETASLARAWTAWRVYQVLRNEAYIGTLVTAKRLKSLKRQVVQPEALWQRVPGACPVLVNPRLFELAQLNIRNRRRAGSDEALLSELRELWSRCGRLSHGLIANDPHTHSTGVYIRRFGSLERAFELIGYERSPRQVFEAERIRRSKPYLLRNYASQITDDVALRKLRILLAAKGKLTSAIIAAAEDVPWPAFYRKRFGSLRRAYALVGYAPGKAQFLHFKA